ncbi:lysoplasmalogenase family protein [Tsuneonella sp. HG222]
MPKRALMEKRPILLASLAASLIYFALRLSPVVPEMWLIPLKGAGVGLLALYVIARGSGGDARLLALGLLIAALADMAIDVDLWAGALLFIAYHAAMIVLYRRHPREATSGSQKGLALAMLILTPAICWLLPVQRGEALQAAIYGLAVGAMAAFAWMSAFPRYRVGVGAALFLLSDLLIVAGRGPLMGETWQELLIWPLYYLGQLLICLGAMQRIGRTDRDAAPAV